MYVGICVCVCMCVCTFFNHLAYCRHLALAIYSFIGNMLPLGGYEGECMLRSISGHYAFLNHKRTLYFRLNPASE